MSEFDNLEEAREDLEAVLIEVIASLLSEDAMPCGDDLPPGDLAASRLVIHDEVEDAYLLITSRLGMPLARILASRMMTVADPNQEDVLDAVGELGNMTGGNVKSLFCEHARLSLPKPILGEDPTPADPRCTAIRANVLGQVVELLMMPVGADEVTDFDWPPNQTADDEEVAEL